MTFHRHCFAWVRIYRDTIGLLCVHCWDEGVTEPKTFGDWMEQEGDEARIGMSQAAFRRDHATGCVANGGMNFNARRRRAGQFDWGA